MSAVRQFVQRLVWNRSPTRASAPPQTLCHPDDRAAHAPPAISARPFIGVLAVLIGAIISTLDSRITSFGLADVRGAVHAGFDEGAWITTAFTVGQIMGRFRLGWAAYLVRGAFSPSRSSSSASQIHSCRYRRTLATSSPSRRSADWPQAPSFRSRSASSCRICRLRW